VCVLCRGGRAGHSRLRCLLVLFKIGACFFYPLRFPRHRLWTCTSHCFFSVVCGRSGMPPPQRQRRGVRRERAAGAVTAAPWPPLRILRNPPAGHAVRVFEAVAAGAAVAPYTHVHLRQREATARPPLCDAPAATTVATLCPCTSHDLRFFVSVGCGHPSRPCAMPKTSPARCSCQAVVASST